MEYSGGFWALLMLMLMLGVSFIVAVALFGAVAKGNPVATSAVWLSVFLQTLDMLVDLLGWVLSCLS